ncbi:hypothetical protein [Desulfatitalea alkaliphila]|uniref:Uncharacterized protein n=1 Tax=Desulfatitalea alkaliphila TaxID=2929485 RepID=A0AA41R3Y3_9BACT|nr:hypothetical protein [Desulfatitalea alkaliphila]MCJ8501909.1 hypothetical protein [Desulfatitalea alkaliphila]
MFFTVLIVLFVLVFGFLGWRMMAAPGDASREEVDTYTCPRCNEHHCDCYKEEEEEKS